MGSMEIYEYDHLKSAVNIYIFYTQKSGPIATVFKFSKCQSLQVRLPVCRHFEWSILEYLDKSLVSR
jgi:hypothetical protein